MVPMTRIRRVRSSKCDRVHISPQGERVIIAWNSALKPVLPASARSTQASPSTLRRTAMPFA